MGRMVFHSLLVWQRGVTTALESEAYCREFDIRIGGFFSCLFFNNRHSICKCNEICNTAALRPIQKFSWL